MKKIVLIAFIVLGIYNKGITQIMAGLPDSSFGINGLTVTNFPNGRGSNISSIAIQADGKIVAAGSISDIVSGDFVFALARYKLNGTLDSAFGLNGIVIDTIANAASQATGVALQADGKIVVCGTVSILSNQHTVFTVVRFNTDGSVDRSFGINGVDTTGIGHNSHARAIAIEKNGKIVIAGDTYVSLNVSPYVISNFAIARYKANGMPDSSFGINGIDTAGGFSAGNPIANAIAITTDEKIIVAGNYENYALSQPLFAAARYNSNGTPDNTFGTKGLKTTAIGLECFAEAATLQSDGKIIVAGYSYDNESGESFDVARYNINGSADSSFGSAGITITAFPDFTGEGSGASQAFAVALQEDGKILAAGTGTNYVTNAAAFEVARYNTAGNLDNTFGAAKNGEITAAVSSKNGDGCTSIKLANSRIYVAGESGHNFAIAAFRNDAAMPVITTLPVKVSNLCPLKPVILTSSSPTGNVWNTGATTQSITTDTAGSYSVTVNAQTSAVTKITYKRCTKPASTGVAKITSTTATVYWSKEPCKSDYTLEYRKVGATAFTTVIANDTLHKISGLLPLTNYQWKVRTICVDTPLTASDYTTFANFATTAGFAEESTFDKEINDLTIVPNPAHSSITVNFIADNVNTILQVINATGQSVIQKKIASFTGKSTAQLDVSKLTAGIYMLLIKTKSGIKTKEFVKE
jgi:uncharacterized delta-60 repeat protein